MWDWTRVAAVGLMAVLFAPPAVACSIVGGFVAYEPGNPGTQERELSPPWEPVPRPLVRIASVENAKSDVPGRCDSYTYALIEVSVPEGSAFSVTELGFVFRSPDTQDPYLSFPNIPISSKTISEDGATMRFRFGFESGGRSVPLEVFAMNKAMQVGPSTVVVVELPAYQRMSAPGR